MPETDNITQGQLTAPARTSPIQSALNDNDDALNAALNALSGLENMLAPVLSPASDVNKPGSDAMPSHGLSAHVGHIENQCLTIANLVKHIEDIARRLEV